MSLAFANVIKCKVQNRERRAESRARTADRNKSGEKWDWE